jgi:hypothetical protein
LQRNITQQQYCQNQADFPLRSQIFVQQFPVLFERNVTHDIFSRQGAEPKNFEKILL